MSLNTPSRRQRLGRVAAGRQTPTSRALDDASEDQAYGRRASSQNSAPWISPTSNCSVDVPSAGRGRWYRQSETRSFAYRANAQNPKVSPSLQPKTGKVQTAPIRGAIGAVCFWAAPGRMIRRRTTNHSPHSRAVLFCSCPNLICSGLVFSAIKPNIEIITARPFGAHR
jgi:hypothetical protein